MSTVPGLVWTFLARRDYYVQILHHKNDFQAPEGPNSERLLPSPRRDLDLTGVLWEHAHSRSRDPLTDTARGCHGTMAIPACRQLSVSKARKHVQHMGPRAVPGNARVSLLVHLRPNLTRTVRGGRGGPFLPGVVGTWFQRAQCSVVWLQGRGIMAEGRGGGELLRSRQLDSRATDEGAGEKIHLPGLVPATRFPQRPSGCLSEHERPVQPEPSRPEHGLRALPGPCCIGNRVLSMCGTGDRSSPDPKAPDV